MGKKIIASVLVMIVCVAAAFGQTGKVTTPAASAKIVNKSGFPVVTQPLTLKFMGSRAAVHGPWENMLVFSEYEKKTGMKIVWEAIPQAGYREKLNLMLASGDLPDAIVRAQLLPQDVAKYGPDGLFIPLEGLVKEYAPNISALFQKYPDAYQSSLDSDGHLYALPAFVTLDAARTEKHWLNKTWLDKLGLKVPETFAELKQVLIAFRDKDPNGNGKADEIPMSARNFQPQNNGFQNLIQNYMGSFGVSSQFGYWVTVENGKALIWVGDDRYKALLEIFADFYKEGLLDKNFLTHTQQEWLAKHNPNTTGFFANQADDTFTKYSNEFIGIAPFKGPEGKRGKNHSPVARDFGTFVITSANKYPEATIRWIDYFYSQEGSRFFRMGIEGKTYYKDNAGKYVYSDEIMKDPRGSGAAIGQFTIWPQGGAPHLINDENSIAVNSAVTSRAQLALQPWLDNPQYGLPIFSPSDQDAVIAIRTDLDTYVLENAARFINGSQSFSRWNEYLAGLNKIGMKKLESYYQKTYEAILKAK